ncbi:MAG: GlsB/YeaQ/YmgE family stress response membrane protein [Ignavibacteriae bacterium]|nr:MAG: GlsB/YeaQ/YmgE family stress response membrane protein [Ignavibacteriota bacterium]
MLSLIWSAIIGIITGALARFITPGKEKGGIFFSMFLGIVGAIGFTLLGRALGLYEEGESAGFFGALIGSIIVLLIYRFIRKENA